MRPCRVLADREHVGHSATALKKTEDPYCAEVCGMVL